MSDAYARRVDPDTSREAADWMDGDNAGRMERLALGALRDMGGKATSYQCVTHIQKLYPHIADGTVTPRMKPLEKKGLIERTEERGPGHGSRTQTVWSIVGAEPVQGRLFRVQNAAEEPDE